MINLPNTKQVFNWLLIAGFILMSISTCTLYNSNQEYKTESKNTKEFFEAELEIYKNEKGELVNTIKSLAGDKDQLEILNSKLIDSTQQLNGLVKKYKKVAAAAILNTKVRVDSVFVPFDRPIALDFSRKFKTNNPYYMFEGRVDSTGVYHDIVSFDAKISFVTGLRKNGWFKSNFYAIDVKSDNPFVTFSGVDSYVFTPDIKKWSIGPYVGYDFIGNNIALGISIQYGLIRF